MQHIQTVVVGSGGAASITFSAIPDTFTDLCVLLSVRGTDNFREVWINPNGSSANGTTRALRGNGSGTGSYSGSRVEATGYSNGPSTTASTFSSIQVYIPNYRSSAAKSVSSEGVTENNATDSFQTLNASLWNVTDAITSLTFVLSIGNFVEHSSASLYGVLAGSDGIVSVS